MSEDLKKPWDYDNRIPYEYPKIVQEDYATLYGRLDKLNAERLHLLINQIYKVAYVDGFEDALYYKDL